MTLRVLKAAGTTLVELMVALAVFTILISLLFPVFSFLNQQMASINDKELLNQRGERVMNYLAEEIRMTGFLTGSNPGITFCGTGDVNAMVHTDGALYDSLVFLTSIPIEPTEENEPFFEISTDVSSGDISISVNTTPTYVSTEYIDLSDDGSGNAKALITFDTLGPTILQKVYEISAYSGSTLTLTSKLAQQLNTGSQIFAVRRKQIIVDTTDGKRDLQIAGWDNNCNQAGMRENIYGSLGPNDEFGGIDGLQFEYILEDSGVVSSISDSDLPNLKAVTIWILLKAGFPSRNFTDNSTYALGTVNPINVGPFNDDYRRLLLKKTVGVENLVF